MSITIKGIAKLAGVSTGTVDRALHNRGRVSPEVAERIKRIAKEHSYEPSRAARALALSKKPVKIGVLIQLTKTEFMQQVMTGIEKAKEELEDMGAEVVVREIPSLDIDKQLKALDELVKENIQGLVFSPAEDDAIVKKINQITDKGIPVITFNTDVSNSNRLAFVGLDNTQSGATAAGLMAMLLQGKGRVVIVTGHLTNWANSRRVDGFVKEIANSFPDIQITGVHVCFDEDSVAEEITIQALKDKSISGVFVSGGGQEGVSSAVKKLMLKDKVKVIAYDLRTKSIEGLKEGVIDFLIDQNAFQQGYKPLMMIFELLFSGNKDFNVYEYTDTIIKTKYNI